MSKEKEELTAEKKEAMASDKFLGRLVKDKVTGFTGIAVVKGIHLFGCNTYSLQPLAKDGELKESHGFDEGRLEIIGPGITADEVKSPKPGGVNVNLMERSE